MVPWERVYVDEEPEEPFARTSVEPPTKIVDGGSFSPGSVRLEFVESFRSVDGPPPSLVTENDKTYSITPDTNSVSDGQLSCVWSGEPPFQPPVYESSDPSVATVSQDGGFTYQSTGKTVVSAYFSSLQVKVRRTIETRAINTTVKRLNSFVEGSLGYDLWNEIDARASGVDPLMSKDMFSSFPSNFLGAGTIDPRGYYTVGGVTQPLTEWHAEPTGAVNEWIKNPNCWVADVDLSCRAVGVMPLNKDTIRRAPAATMITDIHWISCLHGSFYPRIGDTLYFRTSSGLETRVVVDVEWNGLTDSVMGILNSPLNNVTPCKLAPLSLVDKVSQNVFGVPVLYLDQQFHAQVGFTSSIIYNPLGSNLASIGYPRPSIFPQWSHLVDEPWMNRVTYWRGAEYLDSGNPIFLVNGGSLVLIMHFTFTSGGTSYVGRSPQLQAFADYLSNKHSLPLRTIQEANFSSYPNYSNI